MVCKEESIDSIFNLVHNQPWCQHRVAKYALQKKLSVHRMKIYQNISPDVECVMVEETWHTVEGQSIPSGDEWVECSSTPVDVLDAPEVEEQESADETITAVERSVDEEGDGVEVIPRTWFPMLLGSVQSLPRVVPSWLPQLSQGYQSRCRVGLKGRQRVNTVTFIACPSQFAMQFPSPQPFCLKFWPAW